MAGVDVGTAYLTVVPSAKGFSANLQREIGGGMAAAGKSAGDSAAKGFGASFKSGIATVAKAGALGLAAVFAGGVAFAKDAVAEARESQKVGAITEQVIKTTGGAAKVSAAQIGDLATAISNKTGVDDEAIQSGANLLLTFKNVKNEVGDGANIFDRATAAALDLSKAGFGDMSATSKQLGKALNDPVAGITALSRSGVTFTDQQKEQIKTLVASGKTLEAQKIILGEVESQVGGTAEASATMGEKLSTSFGNFKEKVGTALLPILDKIQAWLNDKVVPAMSKFVDEFMNGVGPGGEFRDTLEDVIDTAKDFGKFISENADTIKTLVVVVGSAVAIFQTITTVARIYTGVQTALNIVLAANPIGLIVIAVAALVAGLIYAYKNSETFRDIVDNAFTVVKIGALTLARVAVGAFQFLANVYMTVVEAIVVGAAKAFGWVPGLGPKLQAAAGAVSKFKDDANAALNKIQTDLEVSIATEVAKKRIDDLAKYYRSRNWTAQAGIMMQNVQFREEDKWSIGLTPRAHGGPVSAGGIYQVGDNPDGSWNPTTEVFVPKTAGTVLNQEQLAALGGGGRGMSKYDIDRIVYGFSQIVVRGEFTPGSVSRALG